MNHQQLKQILQNGNIENNRIRASSRSVEVQKEVPLYDDERDIFEPMNDSSEFFAPPVGEAIGIITIVILVFVIIVKVL